MRKAQRWRYYCDHCKKIGGSAHHMARHERGCTANPGRVCGICDRIGLTAAPLAELISLVHAIGTPEYSEPTDQTWFSLSKGAFATLREKADNCPCCILAALRQSNANTASDVDFNFRQAIKDVWKDYDDDAYQERIAPYHAYS